MPSLTLIKKAYALRRATNRLSEAQENSVKIERGQKPRYPWYEECWTWFIECLKDNCCQAFCPCCVRTDRSGPEHFLRRPCIEGTFENYSLKSILGFVFGLILTTVLFFFLINQLNCNPKITVLICCITGTILTNGLAFSHEVRCLTFLALPELFSKRGRTVLMAYVYILVMSGPTKNALRNANILVRSLNCGMELVIKQTKAIMKAIFAPLLVIVNAMRDILKAMKEFAKQMKEAFIAIRDLFLEILSAIKAMFQWLMSMVDVCNSKYGTPYEKCLKSFEDAVTDCREKMGVFQFLCEIVTGIKYICEIAKIVDLLCAIPKAVKVGIIEPLKEHFKNFAKYMHYQFYVNVTFVHHYNYSLEQSKSFQDIRGDIEAEIKERTERFTSLIDWSDLLVAFVFLILIFKAYIYRIRYLTADHFDNLYISHQVRDIDDRRALMDKETILPLNAKESKKYVSPFSVHMVASERKKLATALSSLLTSGIQMALYMVLDYALYHLLVMIRFYGRIESKGCLPNVVQLQVKGTGVLADMYRQIINQFDPLMSTVPEFDTTECLPEPIPIDLDTYQKIILLYLLCVLLALTESYGLRMRHVICGCYHPEREKLRAMWLYNRILRSRGGLRKHLRRMIRRKLYGSSAGEKTSFVQYITSRYKFLWVIAWVFGYNKVYCFSCNETEQTEGDFKKCITSGCKGIYCPSCFNELNDLCTLCMKPVDYGDFSDISEEKDSSDEDEELSSVQISKSYFDVESKSFDEFESTEEMSSDE